MPSLERNKAEVVRRTGFAFSTIFNLIEDHDVISFDVLGTLLIHYFFSSGVIFRYMERSLGVDGFAAARLKAEQLARRRFGMHVAPEASLDEIYEVLSVLLPSHGVTPSDELAYLKNQTYADKSIGLLAKTARENGKRVIGVSDTCLDKVQVSMLLDAHGIELDGLFTTLDFRREALGKLNGCFFSHVADIEGVAPHRILHLGEHQTRGVENALKNGLTTINVRSSLDCMKQDESPFIQFSYGEKTVTEEYIQSQIAARLPSVDPEEPDLYSYGFNMCGPLLLGVCDFVAGRAKQNEIEHLLLPLQQSDIVEQGLKILQLPVPKFSTHHTNKPSSKCLSDVSAYLFDDLGEANMERFEVNGVGPVSVLFSSPSPESDDNTPSSDQISANKRIRSLATQCVQRGALEFLRMIAPSKDVVNRRELTDYNRQRFLRLTKRATEREYRVFEDVPVNMDGSEMAQKTIGMTWKPEIATPQNLIPTRSQDDERQLRNYELLLPNAIKQLSLRDDISQLNWLRLMYRHPFKVAYWNSVRRYLSRKKSELDQ